jgi:TnpA family transposase
VCVRWPTVPVEFLSDEQVARFGGFVADPSPYELERFFRLDAEGLGLLRGKRRDANRLGFAVQWGTVRMLGTFLGEDPAVPAGVAEFVADQLGIADPACLRRYAERPMTAYEHQWEIRRGCGYREFAASEAELRAFLAARVWAVEEGPRALFDRSALWLIEHRVLLPGITVLARLVAEVRSSEHDRIQQLLANAPTPEQHEQFGRLLRVAEDSRRSGLDRLKGGPVNISGRGFQAALERAFAIKDLGAGEVQLLGVPPAKLAALARYGLSAKAPALRELSPSRRAATLLATLRRLEVESIDDALDLFDLLMATRLLARAERESEKAKLASLPALRRAAGKLARAVAVLLQVAEDSSGRGVSLAQAWAEIERVIPRGELTVALEQLEHLAPDRDDGDHDAEWRAELVKRYASVTGFLALLARVEFGAIDARRSLLAAVEGLPALVGRKRVLAEELDGALVAGSWRRLVLANPELPPGVADHRAYVFCVLEGLHRGLRRREIYAEGADRWGDPRARLLDGERWETARPRVLEALDLPADPDSHLQALAVTLDDADRQVASELHDANGQAVLENGKIRLERLGPAPNRPGLAQARAEMQQMMPRVDLPDVLLEIFARTGVVDCFTHVSGASARMDELEVSLCAVLLAEACNIGLRPMVNAGDRALTRGRLRHVDAAYVRPETMSAANARFIDHQAQIPIVEHWGGGMVVSVDGLRFVVPVRSLWAGPNPRYFGLRHRGATWLNVVNDRVMGVGGLVVPGTLRDSLFILDAILNRDGGPQPEVVITDAASYSDIVFGLFAICGYRFSPRIADLTDSRMWLIDPAASYGILDQLARHRVRLDRVRSHWPDMLRVAGSLTTGEVRAYDLIRMVSRDGRPTGLGEAFAHYGRIFKTLHILQVLHDERYRRMIGFQLNLHESRNGLARRIRHGQHGQLRERYREGMEDQLGALGLVLNATVLWNTIYMDKARAQRQAAGRPIPGQILESLSPLIFEHLNFSGRYPFNRHVLDRPLRDPDAPEDDET